MINAIRDYRRLKKHQRKYTKTQIQVYQLQAIKEMVAYAKKHSPFYQKLFEAHTVDSLESFRQFPTIDKTKMMEHFNTLNTENIDKEKALDFAIKQEQAQDYAGYYQDRYVVGMSSGTSGNKGLFITPKSLTKRLPAVFLARSGLSLKEMPFRILFLLRVFSQGFDDINAPFIKLKYLSTMTPLEQVVDTLNRSNTNILMAPPSMLNQLLPYHAQINVDLKKIITYAEVLTLEDKNRFETLFNTQVMEIYQASEGQIASPCSHGNLHINEDLVYVELYDKNDDLIDQPHVVGHKMIVTNLVNRLQSIIRYEMNDMIVLDDACECGSSFRTIKKILGRQDDIVYFYDQHQRLQVVYPDLIARWIISESDAIREFQVVQNRLGELQITIDTLTDFNPGQLKERILKELAAYNLSGDIAIKVQAIELPSDKNKFKRFVRNVEVSDTKD